MPWYKCLNYEYFDMVPVGCIQASAAKDIWLISALVVWSVYSDWQINDLIEINGRNWIKLKSFVVFFTIHTQGVTPSKQKSLGTQCLDSGRALCRIWHDMANLTEWFAGSKTEGPRLLYSFAVYFSVK